MVTSRRLSNFLTPIFLIMSIMVSAISFAQESEKNGNSWSHQIYFETYTNPFSDTAVHFQKYETTKSQFEQLNLSEQWKLLPYFALRNYQDVISQNTEIEMGFKSKYSKQISFLFAVDREKLNTPANSYWHTKFGLIASDFIEHDIEKLNSEYYLETFAILPEGYSGYLTGAGWYRFGYRYFKNEHHYFDAITAEVRAFDSSSKTLGGSDYQQFLIGPRYLFASSQPYFSFSLYLTKSWTRSYTSSTTSQYWFLITWEAQL